MQPVWAHMLTCPLGDKGPAARVAGTPTAQQNEDIQAQGCASRDGILALAALIKKNKRHEQGESAWEMLGRWSRWVLGFLLEAVWEECMWWFG